MKLLTRWWFWLAFIAIIMYLALAYFGIPEEGSGCIQAVNHARKFCSALDESECILYQNQSIPGISMNVERGCYWWNNTCRVGFACQ